MSNKNSSQISLKSFALPLIIHWFPEKWNREHFKIFTYIILKNSKYGCIFIQIHSYFLCAKLCIIICMHFLTVWSTLGYHGIYKVHLCVYTHSEAIFNGHGWVDSVVQEAHLAAVYISSLHTIQMKSLIYCTQAKVLYHAATTRQVLSSPVGFHALAEKEQYLFCTKLKAFR